MTRPLGKWLNNYLLYAFWHMEPWLEPVPHWFVPDWPCSEWLGAFDGRYVALYVCARAFATSALSATNAVKPSIVPFVGGGKGNGGEMVEEEDKEATGEPTSSRPFSLEFPNSQPSPGPSARMMGWSRAP